MPLTDRIDYLCPLTNNLCYVLAVEKLLGLEIPPKAQWMRVMLNELTRINSHLVWLGTHALDIGAMTVFLYCFREREDILRLFEMVSGQRMMTSYFRIGGLALEPPLGFFERVQDFAKRFPSKVDEYENLLTGNPIWGMRTKGVARITAEDAVALGRERTDAAGQRSGFRSAARYAVLRLRELQIQSSGIAGWRRVCPLRVPRGGDAGIHCHGAAGPRRNAARARSKPSRPR